MYSWKTRRHDDDRIGELAFFWFAYSDGLSDDYDSSEVDARDLWRIWRETYPVDEQAEARWGNGAVRISWMVSGDASFEVAPFAVEDKVWRESRSDKGGFIQEATGWKPSPLQPVFWPDQLAEACGLFIPQR